MAIEREDIERWFTYHAPTPEQIVKYGEIRDKAKELAYVIWRSTPPSADQTAAIRLLRQAVMSANAALACEG